MANIIRRPSWRLPDSAATPEHIFHGRRDFLKTLGLGGAMLAGLGPSLRAQATDIGTASVAEAAYGPLPTFKKNTAFAKAGRPASPEKLVTTFNNFYEFGLNKSAPAIAARNFTLDPYVLKVDGLVDAPMEFDLDQIEALGLEERVYRFRCVEAWSMVVPWIGVPLRKLIEQVTLKPDAKFVAFTSFHDPEKAPGQNDRRYRWPYYEGLRLDEAMNDMTLITTGMYGKRMPPQSGTPLRIVVPWKYGYKGPKSVVRMTFTDKQPSTFWNDAVAREYKFYSNVDPEVPHPRWSQADERYIDEGSKDKPTQWYNGYGEQVAAMYTGIPRTLY